MEPFEIMVSESQERMLCVGEPDKVDAVLALCEKWEVHGTAIGEVTDTGRLRVLRGDEVVGDMPVAGLVDDCPLYDLAPAEPDRAALPGAARGARRSRPTCASALLALLASPNLASRRPLFEQYDSIVQSRTVRRPEEADAAVLLAARQGEGAPAIATSIDGNGRRVAADPYRGTVGNVLECAANLACVGAEPLGLDQLPQLRQPREAAHRLAADRGRPRPRRRLPRARGADRRRQRVALQRGRRGPDLPDAGRRHGRRAARPAPRRPRSASRARATRSRWSAGTARRRWPPPSWPSCAASRCPTGCRRSTSTQVRRVARRGPRGRPRAAS